MTGDKIKIKKRKHNCDENIIYNGEYQFENDMVFFYGDCSVCDKRLVETFKSIEIEDIDILNK